MPNPEVKEAINNLFFAIVDIEEYDEKIKQKLKASMDQPYAFVPLYMYITGANQWDLPDCLLKYCK